MLALNITLIDLSQTDEDNNRCGDPDVAYRRLQPAAAHRTTHL